MGWGSMLSEGLSPGADYHDHPAPIIVTSDEEVDRLALYLGDHVTPVSCTSVTSFTAWHHLHADAWRGGILGFASEVPQNMDRLKRVRRQAIECGHPHLPEPCIFGFDDRHEL